jgi:hypothetical protein
MGDLQGASSKLEYPETDAHPSSSMRVGHKPKLAAPPLSQGIDNGQAYHRKSIAHP